MRTINWLLPLTLSCVLLLLTASACGRGARHLVSPELSATGQSAPEANQSALSPGQVAWPTALPVDTLQPWEEVDADGFVIPPDAGGHSASAINEDSDFTPGRERFSEAGDVTNLDEASRFASGASGAGQVSYAIYEVALASAQPGAVSADVNLRLNADAPSAYWLGLSDYGNNTWKWRGPFSDSHIRITVPAGDYTSGLGSFFICVVAYDGASFDLVGLGVNPRDDGDAEAPPAPATPTVSAQNGGVLVEWIPVIADDLAGYKLYYADFEFTAPDEFGVETVNYLEGGTRYLIAPATGTVYVALSAVDISGNESALSALASADAGAGVAPTVQLVTDVVSGTRGISAQLTATGADTYDFDLDGDGEFDDLTGDPTGSANVNTDATGIIRPAVRGTDGGGGIAFAAVSLIIQVNSRPVAVAHATPASGLVPLEVTFTGEGFDDDGTIDEYAWDFEGDGTYDSMVQNPPPHTYSVAGMYNAKLRVTDNDGSFDVDTLSIDAQSDPDNIPPTITAVLATKLNEDPPVTVQFEAWATDSDGSIAQWRWDFENDGTFDYTDTDSGNTNHDYTNAGYYTARLGVVDDDGAVDNAYLSITVGKNLPPVAILDVDRTAVYMGESGDKEQVSSDATASYDPEGGILEYAWDADGDGSFTGFGASSTRTDHYGSPGIYQLGLRVRDADGAISETSRTIRAYRYRNYEIDSTSSTGYYLSFAVANRSSCESVSYQDSTNDDLMFAQALTKHPTTAADWATHAVDTGGVVGTYTSLVDLSGTPAISYFDATSGDLKFARATVDYPSSSGDWQIHTVDSTGSVGYYTSAVVINNYGSSPRIWIAYSNTNGKHLKFARSTTATPTVSGDWLIHALDSPADSASLTSRSSASWPYHYTAIIAYHDSSNTSLKYAESNTETPSSALDWDIHTVDYGGGHDVGDYPSLTGPLGSGSYPAIAYHNQYNDNLLLAIAKSSHPASSSDWSIQVVDDVGFYPSIARINNYYWIAYQDSGGNVLMLAHSKVANPSSSSDWWLHQIDYVGAISSYSVSLARVDGQPAIAYRDFSSFPSAVVLRFSTLELE